MLRTVKAMVAETQTLKTNTMSKAAAQAPVATSNALNITSLKEALKVTLRSRRPVMVWGPPGVGKSDSVWQLGADLNRPVIDIRLALWEPTDLKGIPYLDSENGEMKWSPPAELPKIATANHIIFLDEFPSATPTTQAAAYQLILNRRIGEYELPSGVDIIAAGNRESDRGVSFKMPKPLANRFIHLEAKPEFDSFLTWAVDNKIDSSVVGYLAWAKQDLFDFNPSSSSNAFATPRSWAFVSQLLLNEAERVQPDVLQALIGGTIGEGLAIKFLAYRAFVDKLPNIDEVLDGKVKSYKYGKDASILYTLVTSLCYNLKERNEKKVKTFDTNVNNFLKFMLDNCPPEVTIMGMKIALSKFNLPIDPNKMSCFDEFMAKYGKYLNYNND